MRPYTSVRAGFSNSDYDNVCDTYGGGLTLQSAWRDLGDLLAHRPGWHFDVVNDSEALWSLGLLGESRLNIHVNEDGRYACFDYAEDTSALLNDIPSVEAWLSTREDKAKQPSRVLVELVRSDDWSGLKRHSFQLRVSWSDGYYSASLPHYYDASFGSTLKDAINAATEMLCQLFGAPTDLASQLTIWVELDETATAQVIAQAD